MKMGEWNRRDTYSWRNVTSNKVEISGTVVHGRTRISIVGNDIYFFGNYAEGYNEEEDELIVYEYNCFDERFASDGFTKETEEVVLCAGIEKITNYAFYNCVNLRKIIIPESVKEIERTSFVGCMNLTVYTPAGSYAERYARENNIPVVLV